MHLLPKWSIYYVAHRERNPELEAAPAQCLD
jgi:hypothetical protein